jgi:hypothetical protein
VKKKIETIFYGKGGTTSQMSSYTSSPALPDERIPAYGNFDGLNLPAWDKQMIQSGFEAVESVEGGWEFLRTYTPPEDQGFMFSKPTGKRQELDDAISNRYPGHSGASYGCTMRVLEFIAKRGWETYAKDVLDKHGAPPGKLEFTQFLDSISPSTKHCKPDTTLTPEQKREKFLALPTNMSLDEQVKALRELGDVPMSYSEMRSRFG